MNRPVRNTRSTSKLSHEENFVEKSFWISQENHQNGIFQEAEIEETAENEGMPLRITMMMDYLMIITMMLVP